MEHSKAKVTSVDLFPAFLERLAQKASEKELSDRISTLSASMDQLPFEEASFDIIWSEGAVYNMGFENGIQSWRKYLKPNGYLVLSEIT